MDPENVINLFDSWWFNYEILKKNPCNSHAKINKSYSSSTTPKFSSLRSILVRSQSDDIVNSFNYASFSPNSVLFESIPSTKLDFTTRKQEQVQVEEKTHDQATTQMERKKSKKRRPGTSKSLSELEFEEVKGFMDLGFVFSEKDKDSSLVEIIPGLQRLGEDSLGSSSRGVTRPYLSEAWENLGVKMNNKVEHKTPLIISWEVPYVRDEIDMKDNLKLWAHNVASSVR